MTIHRLIGAALAVGAALVCLMEASMSEPATSALAIREFVPDQGMCRAKRPTTIEAVLENNGTTPIRLQPRLTAPKGVSVARSNAKPDITLDAAQTCKLSWVVEAQNAGIAGFKLEVASGGKTIAAASLELPFYDPMPVKKLPYIPEPEPVKTSMLIGAHNCPLWEAGRPEMWNQVLKHPERTPALGFYSQENPEVADWETKWAVEHGVSFFIYCWYRASQGVPVKMNFGSAIHDALLKSRFVNRMKFTIMWENQSRGNSGVADEKDLLTNLLPFWIENYFRHPSYLKVDNKPVLFIYRPENLVVDLGGLENVPKAFDKMRKACVDAGFDGLYILGEYRGFEPQHFQLMKQLGLDYTFAYCWYIPSNPTPEQAVSDQIAALKRTQERSLIPQVPTVSQAWSGWHDEGTIWKIPPKQYEGLLRQAKDFAATLPANELGSKMLLLDNWNEWSEGHYIAPYREYGFGYLDAVRKVFSSAPEKHVDLIPQDIGMGPYDLPYKEFEAERNKLKQMATRKASKDGSNELGLVAWWAFDEKTDSPAVLDYSGHRLGGAARNISRTSGIDGNALDCRGGCALIVSNPLLSPLNAMTLECWVKTDLADQSDKWFVNRIQAGNLSSGYRFGLAQGRPCFALPQTTWSHHLSASKKLPVGRWVHLAATFDGKTIRLYMDGEQCGSLERSGPANPNDFDLCLGSYAEGHAAHFTGLLDEVKLYDRALTADQIKMHALAFNTARPSPPSN